ncbi:hypothetical protein GCM10020220_038170 [Nonomuraea rubra]
MEGPIQYDAAIDPTWPAPDARQPVGRRATVFVVPDLTPGNNLYKGVQRSAGAVAVRTGAARAAANRSTTCPAAPPWADIVTTVAVTAAQVSDDHQGEPFPRS